MDTPGGSYSPPPPPPSPAPAGGGAPPELVYSTQPPKKPILLGAPKLLRLGGIGYIIMGQKTKGIVAIAVWVVGLCSFGVVSGLVAIGGAIDGYLQAQALQQGHPEGAK